MGARPIGPEGADLLGGGPPLRMGGPLFIGGGPLDDMPLMGPPRAPLGPLGGPRLLG